MKGKRMGTGLKRNGDRFTQMHLIKGVLERGHLDLSSGIH
jgi:hypothetical protein